MALDRRTWSVAAVLVTTLLAGCSTMFDDYERVAARIEEIIETSWRGGESSDAIIAKLGEPERRQVEQVPNRYNKDQTDEVWTLSYPGLQAKVYKVQSSPPKDLLIDLWVADRRYAVGPYFKVGTPRHRIKTLFEWTCEELSREQWAKAVHVPLDKCDDDDEPGCNDDCEGDDDDCALRCGLEGSTVLFRFRDRHVERIDWDYYWE